MDADPGVALSHAPPMMYTLTVATLHLDEVEKAAIRLALELTGGVQKEAARLLGVSPRVIHYKIHRKYQLGDEWRELWQGQTWRA